MTLSAMWRPTPIAVRGNVDRCTYVAPCPECGLNCDWTGVTYLSTGRATAEPRCACGGGA